MKAAVLRGPNEIRIENVPDPQVEPEGIIVKVRACGVCGSDLHIYKQSGQEGTIFGHEFSGEVAALGPQVKDLSVGQRVTAVGFRPCGKCFWCSQGKLHRCSDLSLVGYQLPGAMAEYVSIPMARLGKNVFPLPDNLSYEVGATVEPLSIALFAIRKAQPKETETAVVFGAGIIGLNSIQVLKAMGVTKILVSGRRPARLRAAAICGASLSLDAVQSAVIKDIMEATSGLGTDLGVECAGVQETFDQAVEVVRGGGRIMLVGIFEKPLSWDPLKVISKNITLVGCLGGNFPGAIELLQKGLVNTSPLISHVFPLDKAQEAFQTQIGDPEAIKVIIKMQ
jgi:threonine dehydrogenase-like Zn-dependent dehydrogenase